MNLIYLELMVYWEALLQIKGDVMLGWDTDQFPTNIYDAVLL